MLRAKPKEEGTNLDTLSVPASATMKPHGGSPVIVSAFTAMRGNFRACGFGDFRYKLHLLVPFRCVRHAANFQTIARTRKRSGLSFFSAAFHDAAFATDLDTAAVTA